MKKHPTPFLIEMDALIANLVRCGFERTPQVKMLRKARGWDSKSASAYRGDGRRNRKTPKEGDEYEFAERASLRSR